MNEKEPTSENEKLAVKIYNWLVRNDCQAPPVTTKLKFMVKDLRLAQLADGDKVICKTAWDLLSPAIKLGIEEQKRKHGSFRKIAGAGR